MDNKKTDSNIYNVSNSNHSNNITFNDVFICTTMIDGGGGGSTSGGTGVCGDSTGGYIYNNSSNISSEIFDVGNGLVLNNTDDFEWDNPYKELFELQEQLEKEEELREECPALKEAWEQYQLIKKLIEDEECDKYTEARLKTFKKF